MGDDPISILSAKSSAPKIAPLRRFFRVLESGLVLTLIGIIAGLAGTFIDGRFLLLFTLFVPVEIHRTNAWEGCKRSTKVWTLSLSILIPGALLFWFGVALNSSRLGALTQDALKAIVQAMPSNSISTTEVISPPQQSAAAGATSQPQDGLLVQSKKELRNCTEFLANSDRRLREGNAYGIVAQIQEDNYKLGELKSEAQDEAISGQPTSRPPAVTEVVRNHLQSRLNNDEARFLEKELQIWQYTYGPEFEPVYRKMVEHASRYQDFAASNPMQEPKSRDDVQHECSNLQSLIQGY